MVKKSRPFRRDVVPSAGFKADFPNSIGLIYKYLQITFLYLCAFGGNYAVIARCNRSMYLPTNCKFCPHTSTTS